MFKSNFQGLFFYDEDKLVVKENVPWSAIVGVEVKGQKSFVLHTTGRTMTIQVLLHFLDAIGEIDCKIPRTWSRTHRDGSIPSRGCSRGGDRIFGGTHG